MIPSLPLYDKDTHVKYTLFITTISFQKNHNVYTAMFSISRSTREKTLGLSKSLKLRKNVLHDNVYMACSTNRLSTLKGFERRLLNRAQ